MGALSAQLLVFCASSIVLGTDASSSAAVALGCGQAGRQYSRGVLSLRLRGGGKEKEEPLLCRFKKGGTHFEILVNSGTVERFREGAATKDEVLVGNEIFKDVKTGDRPSAAELETTFGVTDVSECIDVILEKGEFQLSVAERKKKTDEKLAQIVAYITSNYMDGRTKLPCPVTRIENALESMKGLKIDPFKSAAFQANEIAKKLKDTLQLVKNEVHGTVTIPLALVGAVQGSLHGACTVTDEQYVDTNAIFTISFMTGDYDRVLSALNKCAKGEFEFKCDRGGAVDAAPGGGGDDSAGKAGGKGKGKKKAGK